MARSVGLNLAKPVSIVEESCKETEGNASLNGSNIDAKKSINELVEEKTITVTVCLNVTFELKLAKKQEV